MIFKEFEEALRDFALYRPKINKNDIWEEEKTLEKKKDLKAILFLSKKRRETKNEFVEGFMANFVLYYSSKIYLKKWDILEQWNKKYEVDFIEEVFDFHNKNDHNIAYLTLKNEF